jgi:predicted peroxiredoxin
MPHLVYFSTNGVENPVKAVLPFLHANASVDVGHRASIVLYGDAVQLMRRDISESLVAVGWPPFRQMLEKTISHQVPIFV